MCRPLVDNPWSEEPAWIHENMGGFWAGTWSDGPVSTVGPSKKLKANQESNLSMCQPGYIATALCNVGDDHEECLCIPDIASAFKTAGPDAWTSEPLTFLKCGKLRQAQEGLVKALSIERGDIDTPWAHELTKKIQTDVGEEGLKPHATIEVACRKLQSIDGADYLAEAIPATNCQATDPIYGFESHYLLNKDLMKQAGYSNYSTFFKDAPASVKISPWVDSGVSKHCLSYKGKCLNSATSISDENAPSVNKSTDTKSPYKLTEGEQFWIVGYSTAF